MHMFSKTTFAATLGVALAATGFAKAETPTTLRDGRIGYAVADAHFSVYQTADGKAECPQGLNPMGPREIFKQLWPNGGKMEDTILVREGLNAFPADHPPLFPYLETQGKISYGLNLDGKVGPKDFTSPEGEKGIDNAFYRVTGCATGFRGPDGQVQLFASKFLRGFVYNRMMIEISGADNLVNDPSVDVTIMRGRDPLLLDSTGEKVAPGGSQRVDERYGKMLIQRLHGKIENGVLITEPVKDATWAWQIESNHPRSLHIRDMRLQLKLTGAGADGLMAGYFDVNTLLDWTMGYATHHLAYDRLDAPEFYWALRKNADAYPDPKTGEMTALSSAITLNMAQVFIQHPDKAVAEQVTPEAGRVTKTER
ncbi:MAG: hypothetical protein K1X51_10725 [Rhodospirillaceae bacterium]|nr:hypothetical protein [Rhodospirillaceae bacterium]